MGKLNPIIHCILEQRRQSIQKGLSVSKMEPLNEFLGLETVFLPAVETAFERIIPALIGGVESGARRGAETAVETGLETAGRRGVATAAETGTGRVAATGTNTAIDSLQGLIGAAEQSQAPIVFEPSWYKWAKPSTSRVNVEPLAPGKPTTTRPEIQPIEIPVTHPLAPTTPRYSPEVVPDHPMTPFEPKPEVAPAVEPHRIPIEVPTQYPLSIPRAKPGVEIELQPVPKPVIRTGTEIELRPIPEIETGTKTGTELDLYTPKDVDVETQTKGELDYRRPTKTITDTDELPPEIPPEIPPKVPPRIPPRIPPRLSWDFSGMPSSARGHSLIRDRGQISPIDLGLGLEAMGNYARRQVEY